MLSLLCLMSVILNRDYLMFKKILFVIFVVSFSSLCHGKSIESLEESINALLETKDATIGVAILAGDSGESISINGDTHLPMQSVFKYHLALAVLDQVDQGNLSLSDEFKITLQDLNNELWSPIRKNYPDGANLTLAEILKFTIAYSDNVGCDVLIRMLGGPSVVEKYLHSNGITDIAIEYNEVDMQAVWERQYENWTTANEAVLALKKYYENKAELLSEESHQFLWDTMKATGTGKDMIKGNLPEGTIVAHKTGSSGINDAGLIAARNNIGVVFLPDGNYFYLSVSTESHTENKKIIADIAKLTWNYFTNI